MAVAGGVVCALGVYLTTSPETTSPVMGTRVYTMYLGLGLVVVTAFWGVLVPRGETYRNTPVFFDAVGDRLEGRKVALFRVRAFENKVFYVGSDEPLPILNTPQEVKRFLSLNEPVAVITHVPHWWEVGQYEDLAREFDVYLPSYQKVPLKRKPWKKQLVLLVNHKEVTR